MKCLTLWMFTLTVAAACNNSKPAEPTVVEARPLFYFYPKANVYFDSANKTYAFLGSDGTTWQTAKDVPAVVRQLMDKGAFLDSPSTPVWRHNETHKLVYAAQLYATAKDTQEVKEPVVVAQKTETGQKKKERKGLGKFFHRIFKGNRPKKEN